MSRAAKPFLTDGQASQCGKMWNSGILRTWVMETHLLVVLKEKVMPVTALKMGK